MRLLCGFALELVLAFVRHCGRLLARHCGRLHLLAFVVPPMQCERIPNRFIRFIRTLSFEVRW